MIKILPLLLAISVGDRYYDWYPEIELKFMYHTAGCVMDTGWWTVEEVKDGEMVSAHGPDIGLEDIDIQIVFFAFAFDLDAYFKGGYELPIEAHECYELHRQVEYFNQCIDFIHHPETLLKVCRGK